MKFNLNENVLEKFFIQQNKLLEQTNKLIENQNSLLQKNLINSTPPLVHDDEFVENLWQDEMRSGFLVTSHRKRLWNAQIGLINEFDRICKKHNLRWFANYGTLLGAARHNGFVPWDDDVDLGMLRPDYAKFLNVAPHELPEWCFLEIWNNYLLESEGASLTSDTKNFQFVSREAQERGYWVSDIRPIVRIMDKRTTMVRRNPRCHCAQGAWIDIAPFDPMPPFKNEDQLYHFEVLKELQAVAIIPATVFNAIKNNQKLLIEYSKLEQLLRLPFYQRGRLAEDFALKVFEPSEYIARSGYYLFNNPPYPLNKSDWFNKLVYLPFEKIQIPCPVGYEQLLKNDYGDWRTPVITPAHSKDGSADIPYEEYFKKSVFAK